RWRRWAPSMGRHWGDVHEKLHVEEGATQVVEPEVKGHKHTGSGNLRDADQRQAEDGDETDDDDDDEGLEVSEAAVAEAEEEERKTHLARWAARHWMRVAGIRECDIGLVEDEKDKSGNSLPPDWTRGIAPRLEGRIVIEDTDYEMEKINDQANTR
ncbi:MAG: hypothetical protein Q9184_006678, partial [Pyrenodesmia sp. 2 TL-2023]